MGTPRAKNVEVADILVLRFFLWKVGNDSDPRTANIILKGRQPATPFWIVTSVAARKHPPLALFHAEAPYYEVGLITEVPQSVRRSGEFKPVNGAAVGL